MCRCQAEIKGKTSRRLCAGRKQEPDLTQVPSHQIGVVEILHAQSNDVDEFFYDLHELHSSGIDLDEINRRQDTVSFIPAAMVSTQQQAVLKYGADI